MNSVLCPGWQDSRSPGALETNKFSLLSPSPSLTFIIFLSFYENNAFHFSLFSNPRHVFEFPLAASSSLSVSGTVGRGSFSSQSTWLVFFIGFHLVFLSTLQAGPLDRLSSRSDSVNELLDLEQHSPDSLLEDIDIPDLVQVVPDQPVLVRPVSPQFQPSPAVTQRPPLSPISSLTRRSKQSEKSGSLGSRLADQEKAAQEVFKLDLSENLEPPRQGLSLDLALGPIL